MEEPRDHHPEARGKAAPDTLSPGLYYEGDSREDAPLVRHRKFYRRQIFEKLDVQNITEALALATNYGLV